MKRNMFENAAFFGDKLVTLSGGEAADVLLRVVLPPLIRTQRSVQGPEPLC